MRQAIALLTFVNQVDPRVSLNESSAEVWAFSLASVDLPVAKQAVMEFYKAIDGQAASPAAIRKRAAAIQSAREAGSRAIEAGPSWSDPAKFRSLDPKRWDELLAQGAADRQRELGMTGGPL